MTPLRPPTSGSLPADPLEPLRQRALAGDAAALDALCRALANPVFRLCLRMLGDVDDAEDATQEVLVKVVTHLGQFAGRSALTTWVHQIAVRHVLSLRNSRAEERA
jgi:DNA-directed RNA polymerase specialized sigma24 family protein